MTRRPRTGLSEVTTTPWGRPHGRPRRPISQGQGAAPMPHRTFFWFILPSALAMLLFIALPIVSVVVQSLFVEHRPGPDPVRKLRALRLHRDTSVDAAATADAARRGPAGPVQRAGHLCQSQPPGLCRTGAGLADHRQPWRLRVRDDEPAVLQGAGLHPGLYLRGHAAGHPVSGWPSRWGSTGCPGC